MRIRDILRTLLLLCLVSSAFADPYVGKGTAANDIDGGDLTPTLASGTQQGDLILCAAAQKSGSAAPTATGYTALSCSTSRAQLCLLGKIAGGSESSPTIVFSDNTSTRSTIAQCATFRQTLPLFSSLVHTSGNQNNAASQNVTTPALTITQPNTLLVVAGYKERDWDSTDIAAISGFTEIDQPERASTQNEALVWDYAQQTTATNLSASSFDVPTGGTAEGVSVAVSLFAAPAGRQYVTLTSIDATSWCNDFNVTQTPDIVSGDILSVSSLTSPNSHAVTIDDACNLSYGGSDSSRQLVQYDIFDVSASGWMSGGPGNLWFNNQAPIAPVGQLLFTYPYNAPMTPTDLSNVCTDAEGDALTVTNVDALPPGLSISSNILQGTGTFKGVTPDVAFSCCDVTGDCTVWN